MALHTVRLAAIVDIGTDAAALDSAGRADPLRGRRLGPYRLLERAGAGAHATVYRARHELMEVDRAIKVLRLPATSPAGMEQFLREARLAATLRHANLISVYDCGCDQGTVYIVMEYVAGLSLAGRLRRGMPPSDETLRVAGHVASALDHAHERGIVHRDVKPANILLGEDGTVRLGDFGIARLDGELALPEPGLALGTPAYMSPEQCLGQPAGAMADVYSLAAVLYEMLTGRPPYGSGRDAIAGHLGPEASPPARSVNPYLPAAVDDVLAVGLAHDPGQRPASAGQLVQALGDALDGRGIARLEPAVAPVALPAGAGADATDGLAFERERPAGADAPAGRPARPAGRLGRVVSRLRR